MKFKILAGFGLSAVLLIGACGGGNNTNTNNANVPANRSTPVPTPTAIAQTNESAATDPALKSKVEDALKKKGYNDITVDTSTPKMTLRGSVAKDKLADVMATVMAANGGKPVDNQISVK
ncbi:MAG TPA: hypothetical protein VEQ34_02445 [Pyrinomonadaceae bacterium]|nr:hypothetical protein [Pyrinomonadaceae bacterium]